MVKYLTNLDLNRNQLLNATMQHIAGDVEESLRKEGLMWYDTTNKLFKMVMKTGEGEALKVESFATLEALEAALDRIQALEEKKVTTADFADGVIQTSLRSSESASDEALATEKAVRTAIDSAVAATAIDEVTITRNAEGELETIRASNSDVDAGTDANKAVTPATLKYAIDSALTTAVRYRGAWASTADATDMSALAGFLPIKKGDFFAVTGEGCTIDGVEYRAGDNIIANANIAKPAEGEAADLAAAKFDKIDNTESADIVRVAAEQTLSNKTIKVADGNTIEGLTLANFDESLLVLGTDDTDAKAISEKAVDEKLVAEREAEATLKNKTIDAAENTIAGLSATNFAEGKVIGAAAEGETPAETAEEMVLPSQKWVEQLVGESSTSAGSVDDLTIGRNADGEMEVKDGGLTAAKLADGSLAKSDSEEKANAQLVSLAKTEEMIAAAAPGVDGTTLELFDNTEAGGSDHDIRVKEGGLTVAHMNAEAVSTAIDAADASDDKLATEKAVADAISGAELSAGAGIDITEGVVSSKFASDAEVGGIKIATDALDQMGVEPTLQLASEFEFGIMKPGQTLKSDYHGNIDVNHDITMRSEPSVYSRVGTTSDTAESPKTFVLSSEVEYDGAATVVVNGVTCKKLVAGITVYDSAKKMMGQTTEVYGDLSEAVPATYPTELADKLRVNIDEDSITVKNVPIVSGVRTFYKVVAASPADASDYNGIIANIGGSEGFYIDLSETTVTDVDGTTLWGDGKKIPSNAKLYTYNQGVYSGMIPEYIESIDPYLTYVGTVGTVVSDGTNTKDLTGIEFVCCMQPYGQWQDPYAQPSIVSGYDKALGVNFDSLPIATSTSLGVVKSGNSVFVDTDGTLNAVNLGVYNFAYGTVATDLTGATDEQLPTALAVKTAIDAVSADVGTIADAEMTFTNKTIDANDNILSNITVSNMATSAVSTEIPADSTAAVDTKLATEKAVAEALAAQEQSSLHKMVVTNEEMDPAETGSVSWTIAHEMGDDVDVTVKEVLTGDEIVVNVTQATGSVTISFNADELVAAGTFKAILIG